MEKAKKEMLESLAAVSDAMQTFVSSSKKFTAALAEMNVSLKTDDSEGGKRKRVSKTPKDPNAPKRPASSYILFQNEMRARMKEENPNMNHNDVVKQLSAKWGAMSTEDKTVWNNRSDVLKKKYDIDYAAYVAKHPEIETKKTKKEKGASAKPAQPAKAPAKPPSKKLVAAVPAATTSTDASSESAEESSDDDAPPKPPSKKHQQESSEDSEDQEEEEEQDEQESSEEEEEQAPPPPKKAKVDSSRRK